jgi:hypothetical protein
VKYELVATAHDGTIRLGYPRTEAQAWLRGREEIRAFYHRNIASGRARSRAGYRRRNKEVA